MKYWAACFMFMSVFWGAPALTFSSGIPVFGDEVPAAFRQFLTTTLEELYVVKGDSGTPLQRKIFAGPVSGQVYRQWFSERVQRIEMKNDGCGYTARVDSEGPPGVIYISSCVNQNVGSESKVYWLSVLFHEARHLEAQDKHWHHDVIVDSSGMVMAFDRSAMGAYGVEKVFAYNLARFCQNCSADFKQQARDVYEDSITWRRIGPEAAETLDLDRLSVK